MDPILAKYKVIYMGAGRFTAMDDSPPKLSGRFTAES
jgi:hypothetical protein